MTVDVDSTTIFFDDATPNMPPLPMVANIMDSVCPEEIPLPPDYTLLPDCLPPDSPPGGPHSNSVLSPNASAAEKSTVSFALSKKSANLIQGRSVFKASEEEERKARLPLLRKKVHLKKLVELKKEEPEKELSLEELYPSMPSSEDSKPQHRFPMKKFVKADQLLGEKGTKKVTEEDGVKQEVVVNGNTEATNGMESPVGMDVAEEGAIGTMELINLEEFKIARNVFIVDNWSF